MAPLMMMCVMSGYAHERYAYFDNCRAELLRRHKETGETNLEGDGVVSILTKEKQSEPWLKRQYGIAMADVPPECITEKISPVIDWEETGVWRAETECRSSPPTPSKSNLNQ